MKQAHLLVFIGMLVALPCPAAATAPAVQESGSPKSVGPISDGSEAISGRAERPPDRSVASKAQVRALVDRIAGQQGVELALAHAIVAAESAYDVHAVSRAGAIGLMQVMPATAADYGVTDPERLFDPETNVKTGMRHLRRLLGKYDNDYGRVIMAYNAGEGVVDRTNSNVTYQETLDYTVAVIRNYRRNGGTQPTEQALQKVATLRRATSRGDARRLMKRYLDPALLSLKIRPTLPLTVLDPGLHRVGPESRPMFELRPLEERIR